MVSIDPARVAVIIPTLNAGPHLHALTAALSVQGLPPSTYLVIDSSSSDNTREHLAEFGAEVVPIDKANFNHGGTRRFATTLRPGADYIVMMTQDAIPANAESLKRLLASFEDPSVGMAYGRQLPRAEARGIERHARLMNYPETGEVRGLEDRKRIGIKTTFCSDSFAAYRRTALEAVGNFPEDTYFAEDQIVAGRMLLEGRRLAYRADAEVVHSHGYSIHEEFRRYFDVGVFHARNQWLVDEFGKAEGEGLRFLLSEMRYLLKREPHALPSAWVRTLAKYAGYRLGQMEPTMSSRLKKKLSMQPFYWAQKEAALQERRVV